MKWLQQLLVNATEKRRGNTDFREVVVNGDVYQRLPRKES
jgi:hypothetical protein